jgi:hypothetical protein
MKAVSGTTLVRRRANAHLLSQKRIDEAKASTVKIIEFVAYQNNCKFKNGRADDIYGRHRQQIR